MRSGRIMRTVEPRSETQDDPVTTEAMCYPEPLRPPA